MLLVPPLGVDTAAVYRAWDALGPGPAPGANDLTAAALAVEPALARWRDLLGEATGRQPTLAGSGSTWFVEGRPAELGLEGRTSLTCRGRRADWLPPLPCPLIGPAARSPESGRRDRRRGEAPEASYFPARRCQRVAFSIFLCFFLRIRLRRFLMSDPMSCGRLAAPAGPARYPGRVPFRLVALDHVQLAMPAGEEDRAEAFYSGLLGLDRQPKPDPWPRGADAGSPTARWPSIWG